MKLTLTQNEFPPCFDMKISEENHVQCPKKCIIKKPSVNMSKSSENIQQLLDRLENDNFAEP